MARRLNQEMCVEMNSKVGLFFNILREKSGWPDQLCDVMMTCGHIFGTRFEISAHLLTQMSTCTVQYSQLAS